MRPSTLLGIGSTIGSMAGSSMNPMTPSYFDPYSPSVATDTHYPSASLSYASPRQWNSLDASSPVVPQISIQPSTFDSVMSELDDVIGHQDLSTIPTSRTPGSEESPRSGSDVFYDAPTERSAPEDSDSVLDAMFAPVFQDAVERQAPPAPVCSSFSNPALSDRGNTDLVLYTPSHSKIPTSTMAYSSIAPTMVSMTTDLVPSKPQEAVSDQVSSSSFVSSGDSSHEPVSELGESGTSALSLSTMSSTSADLDQSTALSVKPTRDIVPYYNAESTIASAFPGGKRQPEETAPVNSKSGEDKTTYPPLSPMNASPKPTGHSDLEAENDTDAPPSPAAVQYFTGPTPSSADYTPAADRTPPPGSKASEVTSRSAFARFVPKPFSWQRWAPRSKSVKTGADSDWTGPARKRITSALSQTESRLPDTSYTAGDSSSAAETGSPKVDWQRRMRLPLGDQRSRVSAAFASQYSRVRDGMTGLRDMGRSQYSRVTDAASRNTSLDWRDKLNRVRSVMPSRSSHAPTTESKWNPRKWGTNAGDTTRSAFTGMSERWADVASRSYAKGESKMSSVHTGAESGYSKAKRWLGRRTGRTSNTETDVSRLSNARNWLGRQRENVVEISKAQRSRAKRWFSKAATSNAPSKLAGWTAQETSARMQETRSRMHEAVSRVQGTGASFLREMSDWGAKKASRGR